MPGRGKIDAYHNDVASDVEAILGERVALHSLDGEKWYKVRDGCGVEFELVPVDLMKSEIAERKRSEEGATRRVYVFPLCSQSSCCAGTFWVSWHEAWRKRSSRDFVLLSAGWTLFEGLAGNHSKDQILRVDWDQSPLRGSARAGHPHWHFDHPLFISAGFAESRTVPGLVKVTPDSVSTMSEQTSVESIHLAMGAWNKGKDHPGCWQRTYEEDCRQLRDWCVKTLRYLKEQIAGT